MFDKIILLAALTLIPVSCATPGNSTVSPQVSAGVRARLRQPVPVVLMGLQDHVSIQRPVQRGDVWKQATGDAGQTLGDLGDIAGELREAAFLLAPFFAIALLAPPAQLAKSFVTVSGEKADAAARKMDARSAPRNWGRFVSSTVQAQWAAHGASFSNVRIYNPASPASGTDPLSRGELAEAGGRTLLHLHFAGPALTAEGDRMNPRIGPSLVIYWKAVNTGDGAVLARGTVTERSPVQKTLLQWARGDASGLEREMEDVIRRAATRLAEELR